MNRNIIDKNENIDVYSVISTLWKGKIIILSFTIISFTFSYFLLTKHEPQYDLKMNFDINFTNQQIWKNCKSASNIECMNYYTFASLNSYLPQKILNISEFDTIADRASALWIYGVPKDSEERVYRIFNKASEDLTKEFQRKALIDLDIFNKYSTLFTEIQDLPKIDLYYDTQKTLKLIELGEKAIAFKFPSIIEKPVKSNFLILLAILLGPASSMMFVYFKYHMFDKKKLNLTK